MASEMARAGVDVDPGVRGRSEDDDGADACKSETACSRALMILEPSLR